MQYEKDGPILRACEQCAAEDGKPLGIIIKNGFVRGPKTELTEDMFFKQTQGELLDNG